MSEVAGPYRELWDALASAREVASRVAGTLRIGMYVPINSGRYMAKIIRAFTAHGTPELAWSWSTPASSATTWSG